MQKTEWTNCITPLFTPRAQRLADEFLLRRALEKLITDSEALRRWGTLKGFFLNEEKLIEAFLSWTLVCIKTIYLPYSFLVILLNRSLNIEVTFDDMLQHFTEHLKNKLMPK